MMWPGRVPRGGFWIIWFNKCTAVDVTARPPNGTPDARVRSANAASAWCFRKTKRNPGTTKKHFRMCMYAHMSAYNEIYACSMCCFPNCKSLLWMFILWEFSGLSGKKSEFPTCFKSLVLAKALAILWMAQDPKKNREFANVHSQYYWQYSCLYVNMQTHTLQIEVLIQKCSYLIPDLHELT